MNQDDQGYSLEDDGQGDWYKQEQSPQQDASTANQTQPGLYCSNCGATLNPSTAGQYCPGCGHPTGMGSRPPMQTSGFAIASLVTGILSIPGCMGYGLPALILGLLALIFSSKAKAQVASGQASPSSLGLATAGMITGIVGLALFVIYALLMILVVIGVMSSNP